MKYTKKQIEESIRHWEKVLKENYNSIPSLNDICEILKEDGCDFNKPIYINPHTTFFEQVCLKFIDECINKYGKGISVGEIKDAFNSNELTKMLISISSLYQSFGLYPKLNKSKNGDQVIVCDIPEDGIQDLK